MDKQQAQNQIRQIFENPFDKNEFIGFIKNLLNHIEPAPFNYYGSRIKDSFKPYIRKYERIGKYHDGENRIDLLIIHLKREKSIERARTMQRNFVAGYLQGKYGSTNDKDAALAAFVSPDATDWRFSLVKMDYRFEETKTGKVRVKEAFTPARRWSFLVGSHEASHTAQSRLVSILADDEHNPTLDQIQDAFNIETVTKAFFIEYRDLFIRVKEALDKIVQSDAKVKSDFQAKGVDTVNFSKKLLGQIVFLYFLQKKGWFGVGRDAAWGAGSKQFLRDLFEKKHGDYANFFNEILEPLFYEALRIDRRHDDDYYSRFNCKIPFLNGGLFDPIGDYDWVHTDLDIPNALFSNTVGTKEGDIGNGILDVFDRYNFTVKEDEPLEKEVAIDPELLGKAYEKFNAIRPDNFNAYKAALKSGKRGEENRFNKKFGVYYTPREIVHYMCQQSLINYLYSALNEDPASFQRMGEDQTDAFGNRSKEGQLDITSENRAGSAVSREDIETLIRFGEFLGENEAAFLIKERRIAEGRQKSTELKSRLPESIKNYAVQIDEALAGITVCDPAIGSGAFPVGMMHEIVKTRHVLSIFLKDSNRSVYGFKRECIEKSLYGVDIDPGAVEIAKLRLWLSLIVDEDNIRRIQPLPNLDYKIYCGNSLLNLPDTAMKDLYLEDEIEKTKIEYFYETNPSHKNELRNIIEQSFFNLVKSAKLFSNDIPDIDFDFKIHFSEVFHYKNGFDVVICNPPYVRADSGQDYLNFRKKLIKSKTYKSLYEKWDLMVPFIEKGLNILNIKGNLNYIVSNSICTSKYALKLLDLIQEEYFTYSIDYFNEIEVFEAGVVPVILNIGKTETDGKIKKNFRFSSFENIVKTVVIHTSEFKKQGCNAFRKEYDAITYQTRSVYLGDICYISVGMVLNADEKLAKGEFKTSDLISSIPTKKNNKKYIEAKDIENWVIKRIRYLEWGTDRCPTKSRRKTFPQLYNRPKLMVGSLTGGVYDEECLLTHHGVVIFIRFCDLKGVDNKSVNMSIKKFNKKSRMEIEEKSKNFNLKFLLAILNSNFASKYLNNIRRHRLKSYFYPDDFRRLPIADVSENEQSILVSCVDNILDITKDEDYLENLEKQTKVKTLEKKIDQIVYQLYGLNEKEIKIIEES